MFYAMDVVRFLLAIVFLIALPVFLFLQEQMRGLIVALIIQLVTYNLWSRAIKRFFRF